MNIQEVVLRIRQMKPTAQVSDFIGWMSSQYHKQKDLDALAFVRRTVGEFANRNNVVVNMQVWTENGAPGKLELMEQYNVFSDTDDSVFKVLIVSNADLVSTSLDGMEPLRVVPEMPGQTQLVYPTNKDGLPLQYVTVSHQLTHLMAQLTDKGQWYGYTLDKRIMLRFVPHGESVYGIVVRIDLPEQA